MNSSLRYIFLAAIFVFLGENSFAQLTNTHTGGVRFGSSTGFSYRHALTGDRAVEGILSLQSNSARSKVRVTGLYQYHKPLVGDFFWYYGFGGSIGSHKQKGFTDSNGRYVDPHSKLLLSVEGIIGAEYNIPDSPIALSLDIKPYFDFLQESSIRVFDPVGFTIRYKF